MLEAVIMELVSQIDGMQSAFRQIDSFSQLLKDKPCIISRFLYESYVALG